jgi:threonine dehydrogenase-like Zn-dependent dehydrogenase
MREVLRPKGDGRPTLKAYNRELMRLIQTGQARPSWIVSHELPLDQAPEGCEHFDRRDNGWTKVVLDPNVS